MRQDSRGTPSYMVLIQHPEGWVRTTGCCWGRGPLSRGHIDIGALREVGDPHQGEDSDAGGITLARQAGGELEGCSQNDEETGMGRMGN